MFHTLFYHSNVFCFLLINILHNFKFYFFKVLFQLLFYRSINTEVEAFSLMTFSLLEIYNYGWKLFLAPSAPQEILFNTIKAHSFIVYWKKPAEENGELKSYRIRYSFWNGTHSISNTTEVNLVEKFKLTNLYSFVTYNVEVQAKTVEYGPFSKPIKCKTAESSNKFILFLIFFLILCYCKLIFFLKQILLKLSFERLIQYWLTLSYNVDKIKLYSKQCF